MNKKIISVILVILLITSSIAGVVYALDGELVTYVYDFRKLGLDSALNGKIVNTLGVDSFAKTTIGDPAEINTGFATDPWYYYGEGTGTKRLSYYTTSYVNAPGVFQYWSSGVVDAQRLFRIAIRVSKTGNYKATPVVSYISSGGIYEIFLAPIGAADLSASKYSMGIINSYRSGALSVPEDTELSRVVALSSGDYVVTYKYAGPSGQTAPTFNTSAFKLCETADTPTLGVVTLPIAPIDDLTAGTNRTLDLAPISSYGETITYTANNVQIQSDNPSVATAALDSQNVSKLIVTGVSAGQANITVSILADSGQTTSTTFAVTILPANLKNYVYEFKKLGLTAADTPTHIEGDRLVNMSFNTFAKSTAGDPAEINTGVATTPWYYYGEGPETRRLYYYVSTYANAPHSLFYWGSGISDSANLFQLAIRVPTNGNYRLAPAVSYFSGGGIYELFVAPIGATIKTDPKYSVGTIDSYAPNAVSIPAEVTLPRVVELAAGDYVISYKYVGRNASQSGVKSLSTSWLKLKETTDERTFGTPSIIPDSIGALTVGSVRDFAFKVETQYGYSYSYIAANAQVTSSNPTVIKCTYDSTKANSIKIQAIGVGSANLTIAVDQNVSKTITVNVTKNNIGTGKSFTYNFFKLSRYFVNTVKEAIQPTTVVRLAQTTAGNLEEIYPTSPQKTDPWCFDSTSLNTTATFDPNNSYAYGTIINCGTTPGWARFKIDVPADGVYRPVSQNASYSTMGIAEIFVAPLSATDPMESKWSVGQFDAYNTTTNLLTLNQLSEVALKAGEYYVTYYIKGSTNPSNYYRLFVSAFKLEFVANRLNYTISGLVNTNNEQGTKNATVSFVQLDANGNETDTHIEKEITKSGSYAFLCDLPLSGEAYNVYFTIPGYTSYTIQNYTAGDDDSFGFIPIYAGNINASDNIINVIDIAEIITRYGNSNLLPGDKYDLDDNSVIGSGDISILISNIGKRSVIGVR